MSLLVWLCISIHFTNVLCVYQEKAEDPRLVLGEKVISPDVAPFQVSIRLKYGSKSHFCGGSIITDEWILTAAHCAVTYLPGSILIVVGSVSLKSGGDEYHVERVIPHEYYIPKMIRNDIALMKIKGKFRQDQVYKSVKLCQHRDPGNVRLRVTGWGLESFPGRLSENLMQIETISLTNEECLRRYYGSEYPRIAVGKNICTASEREGQGTCKGDSGGPLVEINSGCQVGLVSWGVPCAQGMPDVYARVSEYIEWIVKHIGPNKLQ